MRLLRYLRYKADLTLSDLSSELNVPSYHIYEVEAGLREPKGYTARLERFFDRSIDELLRDVPKALFDRMRADSLVEFVTS